jgi:hypothetical protein
MSTHLQSKLGQVRRKRGVVGIATGAAAVVVVVVAATMVTALLDWWLDLPYVVRALLLALQLAAAAALVVRLAVWPVVRGADEESLALSVEQRWPIFRSRLISAIQLGRAGAVPAGVGAAFVTQLVRETEQVADSVDFGAVVPMRPMSRVVALAIAVLAAGGAATVYGERTAIDLIKRAALVPGVDVPRKTRVVIVDGDHFIAQGDRVTLTAVAEGVVPKAGTLTATSARGVVQEYPLSPDPSKPDTFSLTVEAVPESFQYVVRLNDGTSATHRVQTVTRPAVATVAVRQVYPTYTGLPEATQPTGSLTFLAGSRMVLDVTATKKLQLRPTADGRRSVVKFIGTDVEYPLEPDINDATKAHVTHEGQRSVPLPKGARAMRIELIDDTGVASRNETEYRIDVIPDRAPSLAVTSPLDREMLVTSKGAVNVGFDVADDFAVARLDLKYRLLPTGDAVAEPAAESPNGLTGTYFDKPNFGGKSVTQIDPTIDFDWGGKGPLDNFPTDQFSVRWRGQIQATDAGTYRFTLKKDDGVRLWVDGQQIVDEWRDSNMPVESKPVQLPGGKPVDITLEYFEAGGNASITMLWSRDGGEPEPVPYESLFHADAAKVLAKVNEKDAAKSIPLEIGRSPKAARGFYPWKVSDLSATVPVGRAVEWWLEARDNNDATGPGVAASERYVFRVVTEAEKRAELMSRLGDYFGQIDAVREGQVDQSTKLGTMVQEKLRGGK